KMKDNKELQGFLGIRVIRNEKELTLDQEFYIENLLKKTGMEDCKPVSTPMIIDNSKEKDKKLKDVTNYQSIIGSLIYLSTATRPDIAYAVNQAAQSMQNPTEKDLIKVKRIIRYLKGTKRAKIRYTTEGKDRKIRGYSDASYAEDRK